MPTAVSSQSSRRDSTETIDGDQAVHQTPSKHKTASEQQTPKLTITSKRSFVHENGNGSKRRKLTPDPARNEDDNSEQSNADTAGEDGSDGDEAEGASNREIVIPVAENYDSEESETGMADSLDKMRKTFEEVPHAPGAIVRVQLENFVTYTKVMFEPGPSLNMVIGPNGTGKSTLVCAICLGLGFGPEHLGRAKDIAEFVKNGSEQATIEIELKGSPTDETNPTIKREINRDGSTQYWINGKKQTHKAVRKLTKLLNIQIDNLCQFLPQDRVVEFAGLKPVPLLRETQRAAAPPEVLEDHDELKRLRALEVRLETQLEADRQAMSTMEGRQKMQERDVARLRERQTLQERIKLLENSIPFVEYQDFRARRVEVKKEYDECRKQLKQILKEQEPQTKQIEEAEVQLNNLIAWLEDEKAGLSSTENDLKREKDNVENLKTEEAKAESGLKLLIDSEKERKTKIEKCKERISRIENTLRDDPGELDVSEENEKINAINKELREGRNALLADDAIIEPLRARGEEKAAEIKTIKQWIAQMNNIAGQRVENLRKKFPDSFAVYNWLQSNRDKFKGPVYGPPIVECTVKDPGYQAEIEALFGQGEKLAFTCTNRDDFETLMAAVYGDNRKEKGMGLSEVTIKYIERGLDEFPRIASKDEVKAWGFDGFALDFISGPPEVLSMLCNSIGLHRVGISKSMLSRSQHQSVKDGKNMIKWIAGGVSTAIRRRPDYPAAETEIISYVRPAQYFKAAEVDQKLLEEKKSRISQLETELGEISREIAARVENMQDLRTRAEVLDKEKGELSKQKSDKQQAANRYERDKTHLKNEQDKLSSLEKLGKGFKGKVSDLESLTLKLNMDRVVAAARFAELVREHVARYRAVASAELHAIELSSNLQHYKSWNQSFQDRFDSKKRQCEEIKAIEEEVIRQASQLREKCRGLIEELTSEQQENIKENYSKKTVVELKAEIQQEEVRLEGIREGNPHAIRQYEAREKEMNELRGKMEAKEAELAKHRAKIKTTRERWEPRIDQLVANISEAFSRSFEFIHCAGAVRIKKEGKDGCDYENWAIEILVKFREAESMQVLTAQRQSGGERAVSTVFYLMALQSLARAPFRVVDEINQGMDPRNERLVHKRMVKIACKKHTSQYFLITPKLLVDLDYHERMKVLCINSGDWVAEDHVQDFTRYIAAARKQTAAA